MKKSDIINEITKSTSIERTDVKKTVEALMHHLKDSMIKGNEIFLRGFGTFGLKKRAEKTARNISKNTAMIIPAHYIPKFKPCAEFHDAVSTNVLQDSKGNVVSMKHFE